MAGPDKYTQVKLCITVDGENKTFHEKTKFKQYLSQNTALTSWTQFSSKKTQTEWM